MVVVPNVACALPTAYTAQHALQAYLKVKKSMPGLTPAAWRKAAAQELGLDYDTYLSLWKVHKGSAKALVPESIPTKAAAESSSPNMGFAEAAKDVMEEAGPTAKAWAKTIDQNVKGIADDKLYLKEYLDGDALDHPKFAGLNQIDKKFLQDHVQKIKVANGIEETATSAVKHQAVKAAGEAAEAADEVMTHLGPLNHDLAQSVYKKMKKDMPGATPAVLRHAAADYLQIDYDTYLKAWKKPGTAATKAKQTPASKMPPIKDTPLSPSTKGKYADKPFTADQLKDELATAYGPQANKAYISLDYDDTHGVYKVNFPKSILPTEASKKAVVTKLKDLGFDVTGPHKNMMGTEFYTISNKVSKQAVAKNAAQIKATGTYTLPDGKVVWDLQEADKWSHSWWNGLNKARRDAVKYYTGSGYKAMNSALRAGKNPSTVPHANALSGSMRAMDHEFTVFRGTNLPIQQFRVGKLWGDEGFLSTSVTPGGAWSGVKFEIVVPKGAKGAYVDPHSRHTGEREFLMDMNTQFRIIEVDERNQRVKMVAIPH